MDPARARDRGDRAKRQRLRDAFNADMININEIPPGALPTFIANYRLGSRTAVLIAAATIDPLIGKWTRGLHLKLHGRVLGPNARITVTHLEDSASATVFSSVPRWDVLNAGSAVVVAHAGGHDGVRRVDFYAFNIWDQLRVWARVEEPTG